MSNTIFSRDSTGLPEISTLTLREKVAQLLVMHGSKVRRGLPREDGELERFLEKYPVGGVFVGGEVIEDGSNRLEWVQDRVSQLRKYSKFPLLISADLENGGGDVIPGLTPLPFPMALGAANDASLAEDYGRACAREGALAGINWALAPMADLNLHPLSSNVGTRAFGDTADRVIPLLRALVRGMQDEGMAACAKTFPGDGSDYRDQHLVRTVNRLSREDWLASYGAVFSSLISDGVATIMTGHFSLPAFQHHRENGRALPATLCPELVTGLLKQEMGFQGAVTTDAFGMGGVRNLRQVTAAAVEAFAAGHDLFLWPDYEFIDVVVDKLERGEIPIERLDDAIRRVWALKARYAIVPTVRPDATAFTESVARRTAEGAATLLWDSLLPLHPAVHKRILLVGTTAHDKAFHRFEALAESLRGREFEVEVVRHITPEALEECEPRFDILLFCLERQFHRSLGPMDFFGEDARNLWSACMAGREKTIAVGFGSPYLVPWYFETAATAVNLYSCVPASLEAAVRALCGEIPFPGSMPVRWEGAHSVGGLPQ